MKKRLIAYLIVSATFLSQLCAASIPSFGEEAVLSPGIEDSEMVAAKDFAAVSAEDDDTIMMSAEEEFFVENDVLETESEEILEEMTASNDADSGEEVAIDSLGLIEEDAAQDAESDPFDGILMAAAEPNNVYKGELKADSQTIDLGEASGSKYIIIEYTLKAEETGEYHFIGTGVNSIEVFDENTEDKLNATSDNIDLDTFFCSVQLMAGKKYRIRIKLVQVGTGSLYCYQLPRYCVKILDNSFPKGSDIEDLSLKKRIIYGASNNYFDTALLDDWNYCESQKYYFKTSMTDKLKLLDNADGTQSAVFSDASYGHSWDDGTITEEATCTHTGTCEYQCICGQNTRTETLSKKAHSWGSFNANGDRFCSVCKTKQHDASKVVPVYAIAGSPAKVKVKAAGSRKLSVKWKKPAKSKLKKIKGFYIEVATDSSFKNIVKTKKVKKSKTSFTFKKLKKGTRYYVRIRFYKVSQISRWSAVKNKKVK